MRICVIGKYPPIQGGVSMRTYWAAHRLAASGHEVHVITNAKEVQAPFRMYMRPEDWTRCEAIYDGGSVRVHWSDPVDRSQFHIPQASPFVSKLAAIAAREHASHPFDVIYSHYMEPYGIAAHLAGNITGVPHVTRMAGSDAGRLWRHPQFEALYDHVLRSADAVIARGKVAERAIRHGVTRNRIADAGAFAVSEELFDPQGPVLDLAELRAEVVRDAAFRDFLWGEFQADRPYFGIYGKLGETKGSFALLAALERLKSCGLKVGLVALAHSVASVEEKFRDTVQRLGLTDSVLQIPFLPHWRVPEFLRGCLAICCLEQDFPIALHAPIIPLEVLLSGTCLIGSMEVIKKLPIFAPPPDGLACIGVEDVNDIGALSEGLRTIADRADLAACIGARGRRVAQKAQRDFALRHTLETVLIAVAERRPIPAALLSHSNEEIKSVDAEPITSTDVATGKGSAGEPTACPRRPDSMYVGGPHAHEGMLV